MNLLIHDLDRKEWEKICGEYAGWNIVTDNGSMSPCLGCFSCWNRTPGTCIIKDGYGNMGSFIHEADEIVVISRYTYGGFSGSVKNIFDRCLGYVLPHFEVIGNETHHMRRYDEDKPFTFIFYGQNLSDDEKASAERYVRAVCTNIRGHVKKVEFRAGGADAESSLSSSGISADTDNTAASEGRTIILNVSMRNKTGNSAKFARVLSGRLRGRAEIVDLKDHMKDLRSLAAELSKAGRIILCVPLYVDGLPSQAVRLMELLESRHGASKQIYVLANMGLYESIQLVNLFSAVRQWCEKCGFEYCGGLGISAGELIGALMKAAPFGWGATKKASIGMTVLAEAIQKGRSAGEIFAEPNMFPRSLYLRIANSGWDRMAKKNGLSHEDLYRIPDENSIDLIRERDLMKRAATCPSGNLNAESEKENEDRVILMGKEL